MKNATDRVFLDKTGGSSYMDFFLDQKVSFPRHFARPFARLFDQTCARVSARLAPLLVVDLRIFQIPRGADGSPSLEASPKKSIRKTRVSGDIVEPSTALEHRHFVP